MTKEAEATEEMAEEGAESNKKNAGGSTSAIPARAEPRLATASSVTSISQSMLPR